MALGSIQFEVLTMEKSRIEKILGNMLGEDNELEETKSRNEALLKQIYEMLQESKELKATWDNGTVTISVR